ncbi:MAG TPA: oligosaccharide flippase family protein [Actinomycetota bacterium]|nr:oligosaccharide flippase family protein [Actinomycetota bacterium]
MTDDPLLAEGLTQEAARDVGTVAKGGAIQIVGQMSERGLGFLFHAATLQLLGPGGFGLLRQVEQLLTIAGQLGLTGFNYAVMRFITLARAAKQPGGVRGAAQVGMAGALIGSAIVVIGLLTGTDLVSERFADPGDVAAFSRLLWIGAAYVPLFGILQVLRYSTQAYRTMVPSVVAGSIVKPVTRTVIGVGLVLAGFSVAGAVVSLVISAAIGTVVAGWFFLRMITAEERAATPKRAVGPMIRFALPQGGSSLFGIQSLGLGILLLGALNTDAEVAFFAVGLGLQGPGNIFLGGIVNIWAPVVSDLHARGDIARLDSLYKTINRWVATFSFPVFAAMIIEADLFIRTFFPKAFPGAVAVAIILAAGNLFYVGTGPTGYVISMTGRPGVNFANSVVGVVLYLILGIIFVPKYGAIGMAIVDSSVTVVINSARVVQAKVLVGVQPFGRSYIKPVAATLAGSAVTFAFSFFADEKWPLEVTGIALGGIVFVLVLRVMGLDPEEQHVWQRIKERAFKLKRRG